MLRIANKRKEQDMDFEEKKLHLSVGGVVHDPDAELAYAAAAVGASPPQPHHHELAPPPHRDPDMYRWDSCNIITLSTLVDVMLESRFFT